MIMVSVCLLSDALLQHLLSYLGFSYLGLGVSLHGCSSKVQPLLLTLDEGYLLTATPPDLERGVAPLGPPAPVQLPLVGHGVAPLIYCYSIPNLPPRKSFQGRILLSKPSTHSRLPLIPDLQKLPLIPVCMSVYFGLHTGS